MIKPGDKVAVLDEDLEGRVISVSGSEVEIETNEGFVLSFNKRDLVKTEASMPDILPPEVESISEVIKEKESFKKKEICAGEA